MSFILEFDCALMLENVQTIGSSTIVLLFVFTGDTNILYFFVEKNS